MGGTGKDGRDQLMDMTGFMAHYHRGAGPARLAGRRIWPEVLVRKKRWWP